MRKIIVILIAFISISSVAFAQKTGKKNRKETVTFLLKDEKICHKCIRKISDNIPFEKGVVGLDFEEKRNFIKITYRKDKTDTQKLKKAFAKIKMHVEEQKRKEKKPIDKKE